MIAQLRCEILLLCWQELYLSANKLRDLEGVGRMPQLRVLQAAPNLSAMAAGRQE